MIEGYDYLIHLAASSKGARYFASIGGRPWGALHMDYRTVGQAVLAYSPSPDDAGFASELPLYTCIDGSKARLFIMKNAIDEMILAERHESWSFIKDPSSIDEGIQKILDEREFDQQQEAQRLLEAQQYNQEQEKNVLEFNGEIPPHLESLIRSCWIPRSDPSTLKAGERKKWISRWGGNSALMEKGKNWPKHKDGAPMQLLAQFDNDTLPEEIAKKFGERETIFQLFVPMPQMRALPDTEQDWRENNYGFEVRVISKKSPLVWKNEPKANIKDASGYFYSNIKGLECELVTSWHQKQDLPIFLDGALENDKEQWAEVLSNFHEGKDKLMGWPSLESGEQISGQWDYLVQMRGGCISGDLVAFDGYGWLIKNNQGCFKWITASS